MAVRRAPLSRAPDQRHDRVAAERIGGKQVTAVRVRTAFTLPGREEPGCGGGLRERRAREARMPRRFRAVRGRVERRIEPRAQPRERRRDDARRGRRAGRRRAGANGASWASGFIGKSVNRRVVERPPGSMGRIRIYTGRRGERDSILFPHLLFQ
jgi:hypothetical protein